MFYFHGAKGGNFAVISDDNLQINMHFIGTRPEGRTRDFTWVQALAVMFAAANMKPLASIGRFGPSKTLGKVSGSLYFKVTVFPTIILKLLIVHARVA